MNPIILTHYGSSKYLDYTIESAIRNGGGRDIILIGDEQNRNQATRAGVQHINRWSLRSSKKAEFNDRFRWVQGRRHIPVKNGQDWLRWQWERWFLMECLADELNITRFWHLDSDVIITKDFEKADQVLQGRSERELIAFHNLNGLVPSAILRRLTSFALEIFSDNKLLKEQHRRLEGMPYFALTEMNAVEWFFDKNKEFRWISPATVLEDAGLFMDPAILHSDGIRTRRCLLFPNSEIKDVMYRDGGFCVVKRSDNGSLRLVTANCSWVPIDVPKWFVSQMQDHNEQLNCTSSIRRAFRLESRTVRSNLARNIHVPIWEIIGRLTRCAKDKMSRF